MRGVVADGRVALCDVGCRGHICRCSPVYRFGGAAVVETSDVLYPAALAIVTYIVARLIALFA